MQLALELNQRGFQILQNEINSPAWPTLHSRTFKKFFSRPFEPQENSEYLFVVTTEDCGQMDAVLDLMRELWAWKLDWPDYHYTAIFGLNDIRLRGGLKTSFGPKVMQWIRYEEGSAPDSMASFLKLLQDILAFLQDNPGAQLNWLDLLGCAPVCACTTCPSIPGNMNREELEKFVLEVTKEVWNHPEQYTEEARKIAGELKEKLDANSNGVPDVTEHLQKVELGGKFYWQTIDHYGTITLRPIPEEDTGPDQEEVGPEGEDAPGPDIPFPDAPEE